MARLSEDRERWKAGVGERMKHLYEWENQEKHRFDWEDEEQRLERNSRGRWF